MKTMRKIAAVFMAVVMILTLNITAFAAPTVVKNNDAESRTDKGTITINDAEIGQTYTVYRVFDAVIDEDNVENGVAPATYYLSKSSDLYAWITDEDADNAKYFTLTNDPLDSTRVIVSPSSGGSMIDALKQTTFDPDELNLPAYQITVAAGDNDKAIFKAIPYGYYYMEVQDELDSTNVGVTVSRATPDAVMNLKITRNPGNIDKVVDEKSVEIGQVLTYQSSFKATNFSESSTAVAADSQNRDKSELITNYYLKDTPDEDATAMMPISFRVFSASALMSAGTDGDGNPISDLASSGKIDTLKNDVKDADGNLILNEDNVALKAGLENVYMRNADGTIMVYSSSVAETAPNYTTNSSLIGKAVFVSNTKVAVSDNGLYTAPSSNNGYYIDPSDKNVTILPWTKQANTDVNGDGAVDAKDLVSLYDSPSYVVCTYEQTVGTGIMSQEFGGFTYMDTRTNTAIYTQAAEDCVNPVALGNDALMREIYNEDADNDLYAYAANEGNYTAEPTYSDTGRFTGYKYVVAEEKTYSTAGGEVLGTLTEGTVLYEDHRAQTGLSKAELKAAVDALNLANEEAILADIEAGKYEIREIAVVDGQFINTFDAYWDLETTLSTTPLENKPHAGPVTVESCSTGISLRKLVDGGSDYDTLDGALFRLAKVTSYKADGKTPDTYVWYTGDAEALAAIKEAEATYAAAIAKTDYDSPTEAATAVSNAQNALDALYEGMWGTEAQAADILADNLYETIEFQGLREGEYRLVETKPPVGYGLAPDTYLQITHSSDTKASTHYTVLYRTASSSYTAGNSIAVNSNGYYTVKVNDTQTAAMPETGGIGTTIFRVGGGILVLGAAVLLVTKKRAAKNA